MSAAPSTDFEGSLRTMPTMAHAIVALRDVHEGGFTFVGDDGAESPYTFAELVRAAELRGRALVSLGARPGDRVAIFLPDAEGFVLVLMGCLLAGLVPVPMYPPLSLARLDAYLGGAAEILRAANARLLVCDERLYDILWTLRKETPVETVVRVDRLDIASTCALPDPDSIGPDDVAFLQFTSGSTLAPKGVRVTHRNLAANAHAIMVDGLAITPRDKAIAWLPLYHDMGLIGFVLAPLRHRLSIVLLPTLSFLKKPSMWLEAMARHRGTITFGPNFAFALATRTPPREGLDLSHVRVLGCGAEPINADVLRALLSHYAPCGLSPNAILPCYGMAEATLAISFVGVEDRLSTDIIDSDAYHSAAREARSVGVGHDGAVLEFVSCGRAFPGHEVLVVDDAGRPLPERRVGELVVRGPSVAHGYEANPTATAAAFMTAGLRTGDFGYLVDGNIFVTGRKKDLIILNGRNFDPQEIERAAEAIPGVRKGNVVAFSRPSAATEELVVVVESKAEATPAMLAAILKQIFERVRVPVADVVVLAPGLIPKTSSGKLQRSKARALYLDKKLGAEGSRSAGAKARAWSVARLVLEARVGRFAERLRTHARKLTRRV